MKRKLIICSSLITLLLSCFSFPIFAEETVQDSSNLHTLSDGVLLDQYFYDNYDLLPYLESDGRQYINTGVPTSLNLRTELTFSDYKGSQTVLFGTRYQDQSTESYFIYPSILQGSGSPDPNQLTFYFNLTSFSYPVIVNQSYKIFTCGYDGDTGYFNGQPIRDFNVASFANNNLNIYLFSLNQNGSNLAYMQSSYKLYKFTIYDYSANNGEGGFIRYYYPAKAKTSGAIGLYDAVNKTFIVSGSNVQFSNPTNEYVETFQISSFLAASLTWIGQIFDAIIQMPIIIVFMAIGLAGAMFRWGRRIVHF